MIATPLFFSIGVVLAIVYLSRAENHPIYTITHSSEQRLGDSTLLPALSMILLATIAGLILDLAVVL